MRCGIKFNEFVEGIFRSQATERLPNITTLLSLTLCGLGEGLEGSSPSLCGEFEPLPSLPAESSFWLPEDFEVDIAAATDGWVSCFDLTTRHKHDTKLWLVSMSGRRTVPCGEHIPSFSRV